MVPMHGATARVGGSVAGGKHELPRPLVRCIRIEIRDILTASLKELEYGSPLNKQIRRMRRASRRFMDKVGHSGYHSFGQPVRDSILRRELNRLRDKFGEAIAEISISYGIKVEDGLAASIPFDNFRD